MHQPPIFTNDDTEQALAFAAEYPFATLAVNGEAGPVTSLIPLVYDAASETFLGHVAKVNPFWKAAMKAGKAVAVFRGPDAYISPSSYPSKAEHQKAVPTWNYMAVEVRGDIVIETDAAKMVEYLTPLTTRMESHRDMPWKMTDAPADYMAKLSNAIVGFSLAIDALHFVEKLSQNKSEADREGVMADLRNTNDSLAHDVAARMKIQADTGRE